MYRSVILAIAQNDIRDAAKWYNGQQKGLGKRFTGKVREKVHVMRNNPYAFALRYADMRTARTEIFPFMIHYTILDNTKTIVISAVLHTSLNPNIWTERTEAIK